MKLMIKRTASLALFLLMAACGSNIQDTSGQEYLSDRGTVEEGLIDEDIARIATVEPNLRFPARIGVARIVNGDLTLPTAHEGELFVEFSVRYPGYGEFVPISPFVSSMVNDGAKNNTVNKIRRAAARQHVDYVIIYEIGVRSKRKNTPFALADVTLIGGAFLPTRKIEVAGIGQAVLLDVRNGYPYGTAQTVVDLSGFARTFSGFQREDTLQQKATLKVAEKLVPEIETMFAMLSASAARK